jgi:hypothetical protein
MINLNYNLIGAGGYDRNSLEEAKGFIPFQIQYVIVGGGGGSAAGNGSVVTLLSGEAGGGGQVISGSLCVQPFNTYDITVGAAGTGGTISSTPAVFSGTNGVSSSFNTVFAAGGLGGNIQLPTTSSTLAGDGASQVAQGGNGGSGSVWTFNSTASAAPGQLLQNTYFGGGGGGFVIGLTGSISNNLVEYTLSGGTTITGSFLMASDELYQFNVSYSPTGSSTFQSVESTNPIFISVAGQATSSLTLRYPGAQKAYGGSNIFASGGFTYHQFASSSQYEVGNADFIASYMVLAGGGSGGALTTVPSTGGVGGGAAGTVKIGTFTLSPTSASYNAVIGQGAAGATNNSGSNGGSSSLFGVTSTGGTGGGNTGLGIGGSNEFHNGGNLGGGGAGAGEAGGSGANPPPSTLAGSGGDGYTWLDGVAYGPGGYGAYSQGGNIAPQAVNGGGIFGTGSFGVFSGTSNSGSAGIVALTYFGPQKATGGTRIVYDGSNTYHYFETTGVFTTTPLEAITIVGTGGYNTGASSGSSAQPNTGGGAGASYYDDNGNNGGSGIVAIRYEGLPIAEGGTIVITNNYTYHIYTSGSGSFYAIGQESNNNINPCPSENIILSQFNNNTDNVFATASFNAGTVAASYTFSGSKVTKTGTSTATEQIPFTASMSGSGVWPVTGSNSMTIVVRDDFYYQISNQLFLNAAQNNYNLSGSIISIPFIASNGTNWYVSSSVEHIKGNLSDSNIKWYVTGSGQTRVSSSLNIKKDTNVTMVTASFLTQTGSSYTNNFAMSQTASISSSYRPYYNTNSSSLYISKLAIGIAELTSSKELWISASNLPLGTLSVLTSSFVAQTDITTYTISSSAEEYFLPILPIDYLIVGGGGGASRAFINPGLLGINSRFGGGGAGGLLSGSLSFSASATYPINVGTGGLATYSGSQSSFLGQIAYGGGYGGYNDTNGQGGSAVGGNGGSGGAIFGQGIAGQGNSAGEVFASYNGAGAGNSLGSSSLWLDGKTYAGGGGWVAQLTSPEGGPNANTSSINPNTGSYGYGGTSVFDNQNPNAGSGSNGVVILRYPGSAALASGGQINVSASYVYHTFTSSGNFTITPIKA